MEILNQTVLHGMSAGAADRFSQGFYRHWDMQRLGVKANLPDILASLLPSQVLGAYQKLDLRLKLVEQYDSFFETTKVRPKRLSSNKKTSLFPELHSDSHFVN
mgnify:CR=1 FL=1